MYEHTKSMKTYENENDKHIIFVKPILFLLCINYYYYETYYYYENENIIVKNKS